MGENVTLLAAFGAGLLSFISPCVLPLIPGYLSYISGLSLDEMRGTAVVAGGGSVGVAVAAPPDVRRRILISSAAFILGFTLVFIAIGATASAVGQFVTRTSSASQPARGHRHHHFRTAHDGGAANRVAVPGKTVAVIATPGRSVRRNAGGDCVRVWMDAVHRSDPQRYSHSCRIAGHHWTGREASGGVLARPGGAVLRDGTGDQPLLRACSRRIRHHYHKIELVSGALLVVIGILIFTNKFTIIAQWLTPVLAGVLMDGRVWMVLSN